MRQSDIFILNVIMTRSTEVRVRATHEWFRFFRWILRIRVKILTKI